LCDALCGKCGSWQFNHGANYWRKYLTIGRTQAFKADAMGTNLAFESLSTNMANLRGKKRRGESINPDEFFEDGKIAEMLKNEDES
jgi:hypothetical protein